MWVTVNWGHRQWGQGLFLLLEVAYWSPFFFRDSLLGLDIIGKDLGSDSKQCARLPYGKLYPL